MTSKKELKLAYGVAIVLLVVGVASFAAFSAKTPDEPLRVVFGGAAGNVMFNHYTHFADDGYSVDCYSCHHHGEDTSSCGTCHLRTDAFAESCLECHEAEDHEDLEMATVKGENLYSSESCLDCHDEMETPSARSDAFHGQCIGCHAESEAGPQECSQCHLK